MKKPPVVRPLGLPAFLIFAMASVTPSFAAETPKVGDKIRFLERGFFSSVSYEGTVKSIQDNGKVAIQYRFFDGSNGYSREIIKDIKESDLLSNQDPLSHYKVGQKVSYKTRSHSYMVSSEILGFTQNGELVLEYCTNDNPDRVTKCETSILDRTQVSNPAQSSDRVSKDARSSGAGGATQSQSNSSGQADSGGI